MNAIKRTCPDLETIDAVARGSVVEQEVAAHLERCRECSEAIQSARFAARFGHVMSADAPATPRPEPGCSAPQGVPEAVGYRFLAEIARGGQGAVYRAVQIATGQVVAVKVLHSASAGSGTRASIRFRREIKIAASLQHPGIVRLLDSLNLADGRDALIMELIDGVPLLDACKMTIAHQGQSERLELIARVADAIAHAHQRGVIHCDLKPSNILIDTAGNPHVLDFGVARLNAIGDQSDRETPERLTMTGEFTGTLAYAAPEQVSGERAAPDTRTDIYALGIIAYRMLTGSLPYDVDGALDVVVHNVMNEGMPSRSSTGLSTDVWVLLSKATAKDPARRYQSALDMASDLRRAASGEAIEARGDSVVYRLRKTARAHRIGLSLVSVVMLGLFGVLFVLMSGNARLSLALHESRIQQLRAHIAGGDREPAEMILWTELARTGPVLANLNDAIWSGDATQRDLLWMFLEMQADATCLAELTFETMAASAIDDGRFGLLSHQGRIVWLSMRDGAPALELGPTIAKRVTRGWFDPSGAFLVTVDAGGVECFDARTGDRLSSIESGSTTWSLASSGVCTWGVVLRGDEGMLHVAALPGLEELASMRGVVRQLPWMEQDTRIVAYLDEVSILRVRDIDAGTETTPMAEPLVNRTGPLRFPQLVLTADRRKLVVAHGEGILVDDFDAAGPQARMSLRPGYRVGISLSPDDSLIAGYAFGDATLRLWKLENGEELSGLPGHRNGVDFHAFSRDGATVLTADSQNVLRIWSTPGHGWRRALAGSTSRTHTMAVVPREASLLVADESGELVAVPMDPSDPAPNRRMGVRAVRASVSADGSRMAAADLDGVVHVVDLPLGSRPPRRITVSETDTITGMEFFPSVGTKTELLAVCMAGGRVTTIDPVSGRIIASAVPRNDVVASDICWAMDGSVLVISYRDGHVAKLDAMTLAVRNVQAVTTGQIRTLAAAPDRRYVAAVGDSGELIQIDLSTDRVTRSGRLSQRSIFCLTFHPRGAVVAVGDRAGQVLFVDTVSGSVLSTIRTDGAIMSLAFSEDGNALYVAALGCPLERWDFGLLAETYAALRPR